jgi:hypothetical protein
MQSIDRKEFEFFSLDLLKGWARFPGVIRQPETAKTSQPMAEKISALSEIFNLPPCSFKP